MPGNDIITLIEHLFPGQISTPGKERLGNALTQFRPSPPPAPADYYLSKPEPLFLQGDIIQSLRLPLWNEHAGTYDKKYATAMMLSNTCDVELEDKERNIPKQVIFAPAINAALYFKELHHYYPASASSLEHSIKTHSLTSRFYLPAPPDSSDKYPDGFVIELDKIFWFPISELAQKKDAYLGVRVASLSNWAHYLMLTKLALHICRTPEGPDRPAFA